MLCAFKKQDIQNTRILERAHRWFQSKEISHEQLTAIAQKYPADPAQFPTTTAKLISFVAGIFTALGIFILGSLVLRGLASLIVVVASIGLAERYIHTRKAPNRGFVEAMLWASAAAFLWFAQQTEIYHNLLAAAFLVALAVRYISVTATVAALVLLTSELVLNLSFVATLRPFITILLALFFAAVAWASSRLCNNKHLSLWFPLFMTTKIFALCLIYLSCNYYVVHGVSRTLLRLQLEPGASLPFSAIIWACTAGIPLLYVGYGIFCRNTIFVRVGLAACFVSVATYKYYFSSMSPEVSMTISGILLISLGVFLYNFFAKPRRGFTREKLVESDFFRSGAEAMLIAQTLSAPAVTQNSFAGQGGEFSGGGADKKW